LFRMYLEKDSNEIRQKQHYFTSNGTKVVPLVLNMHEKRGNFTCCGNN